MRLDQYDNTGFDRGRSFWVEAVWNIIQWIFIKSPIPGAFHRVVLLRLFGAKIGKNVNIKPGFQVKFPWRLKVGDHSWIGENVWIDNLDLVHIGSNCCLSQGVYLCSGNHNWAREDFALRTEPIIINDKVWIGACSMVGPGVTANEGAVLALGSVATHDLESWKIHQGNPSKPIRERHQEMAP